ncbi:MAG: adenosylcobinamide-GDP ribazoletransferase [Rhodocyclaceae bacterium]|nr:adenosylcobinamide-GDP ribazoletransferase [Rhodocyclaceae bacterium]
MKDSRIGSYGALAVALMLLAKFNALLELPDEWIAPTIVAAHAASRLCSTTLIHALDYVRDDDSSRAKAARRAHGKRQPDRSRLFRPGAAGPAALQAALAGLLLALLTTFLAARYFVKRIGGYTGDCLGAVQQGAELAIYLGILSVAWNFS